MHTIYKTITIGAAAMVAALMSGCSQVQESAPMVSDTVEVPVTLTVSVAHNLSLQSRATQGYISTHNPSPRRPVVWDNEQSIDDLRLYVFESVSKDGRYVYAGGGECEDGGYLVKEFLNLYPWTATEFETHNYTFTPRLRKGFYYKFLAVGRDDSRGLPIPSGNTISFIPWGTRTMSDANFEYGVTEIHRASLTNELRPIQYPYITTEIFSGMMTYTDNDGIQKEDYIYVEDRKSGFQKQIELRRAVAGLWAYLTDIPTKAVDNSGRPLYEGTVFQPNELTVRMTLAAKELNLAGRTEALGSEQKESIPIGYVDLTNRYGEKDGKQWFVHGSSPYWQREQIPDYLGVTIQEDCALMANFLLPVSNLQLLEEGEALFTLELREYQADHTTTRRVKCHIDHITDPVTGEVTPYNGDGYKFPITANCMYVLGTPDKPLSLSALSAEAAASRGGEDLEIEMTVVSL